MYSLPQGSTIAWVGYHSSMKITISYVTREGSKRNTDIELLRDYSNAGFRQVLSSAAARPGSISGTIWSCESRQDTLRLASILGANLGADMLPGPGKMFSGTLFCVMAYDIEQDRSRLMRSSFPTPSESITCIATCCSCGDKRLFSMIEEVNYEYTLCENSRDTVRKFTEYVKVHSPQWLVGYNCLRYDNTCIAYHCGPTQSRYMNQVRVGTGNSLSYAYSIEIPGTYNVDLFVYLDKTRRGTYPAMSLNAVAEYHGAGSKLDHDTYSDLDFKSLFEYNARDVEVTLSLALKCGALEEIASLAVATCTPVNDCSRFISGTMAACSVASYCLANKVKMDWSPVLRSTEYRGAEVLTPVIGMHYDVSLCDFSSMYPTVITGSHISMENQRRVPCAGLNGSVSEDSDGVVFTVDGVSTSFNSSMETVIDPVVSLFVTKRKEARNSNPCYAAALKVAANSIYGSLGDRNSKIYSPAASSAVTSGGRWCLAVAHSILHCSGYEVVYGDTDSCFVKRRASGSYKVEAVLHIMSQVFKYTPFPGMHMELEQTYDKIAFAGKKTYFGKTSDGQIVSKGMSKSRKDRLGVSRVLCSFVAETALSDLQLREKRRSIGDAISMICDSALCGTLTLEEVSKVVKKGGVSHYEYRDSSETRRFAECESHDPRQIVDYSPAAVVKSIMKEVRMLLSVTSIGDVSSVIRESDYL